MFSDAPRTQPAPDRYGNLYNVTMEEPTTLTDFATRTLGSKEVPERPLYVFHKVRGRIQGAGTLRAGATATEAIESE